MRRLLLFILLTGLGVAEPPAQWDGLVNNPPATPAVADGLSLRLNEAYEAEVTRLGGPAWWLELVHRHCRENIRAAGAHPEAPPLSQSGRVFVAAYAAEQARLAKIQSRYPSEVRWASDEVVGWELPDRTVQFSFDDGPKSGITEPILATLRRFHVPATFFVLGRSLAIYSPDYTGFAVASHSYDHANLLSLNAAALEAEFTDTESQARRSGLKLLRLFRAPYGSRAQRELTAMKKHGLRSMLWNVDSQDWQAAMQARPGRIASRTLALLLLHRHGIVLMHDVQPQTPAELARLLPLLPQLGFKLTPP